MIDDKIRFGDERTEEVQHIIERMPTSFGIWVSAIVFFLFSLMSVFGWIVRYPDIINGQISISTNNSPLKLISNSNGKLRLNGVKSMDEVKEGQLLAYIENSANPKSVVYLDSLLKLFNPNTESIINLQSKLPNNFSLGELNSKYFSFANSLQEFINYKQDRLLAKQSDNYRGFLQEQKKAISTAYNRIDMAKNSLVYAHKFFSRDSTLFAKKVISESELDKTQMSYLTSKDALQNALNNLTSAKQAAQQTESKIQEIGIQKPEKEKELQISLISSYNDLLDNIKSWEIKYIFKAPFDGKVQFMKFYRENQFVQGGEQIFTIVPKEQKAFGQVMLPAQGSGKIKMGQEVIVKLDNYPYLEYGSVTGRIESISLTANITKTEKSEIDTYMLLVTFPEQLKTNYGTKLDFKAEAKGSAEIITNDRRLIQRLFDNLKYVMRK
ncbi:HlyD family efflux transporter periplasmic adaptor subunit [Pedobacter jamesrossensis]|uniref:HlyD family efflux transporter periplasmic adaptor subunit n=1 Tax=Pedobacter jamesrossensis TaxID=1908238 RepID=A0ABV8NI60_9SPHI